MFKKINRYLMLQHPLLWNMRIVQVLVFALLVNALFFAIGYLSVSGMRNFRYNHEFRSEDMQVYLLAGLSLLLGLIWWLAHYLRNNAFKSFYPVKPVALRKEFLLLLLTFMLSIPVFHFYRYGKHLKKLKVSEQLDPYSAIETINMASAFLPYEIETFESDNSCDSLRARAEREALNPYQEDLRCSSNEEAGINSEQIATESILADTTSADYSSGNIRNKSYSYLNYCRVAVTNVRFGLDEYHYHQTAARWLKTGRKDSVRNVLKQYLHLMRLYGLRHNVHADTLVSWCFATEDFAVENTLNEFYSGSDVYMVPTPGHGEFSEFNSVVSEVLLERSKTFLNMSDWFIYFYVAFGLSVVLALFRFSRLKPWLIAIVGLGIWGILFSLFEVLNGGSEYLFLVLVSVCIAIAVLLIRSGKAKQISVLWLQWFVYAFPFVMPLVFGLIHNATYEQKSCINNVWVVTVPEPPIHGWIAQNWHLINAMNLTAMCFIFIFAVIPLLYRWQANPNE